MRSMSADSQWQRAQCHEAARKFYKDAAAQAPCRRWAHPGVGSEPLKRSQVNTRDVDITTLKILSLSRLVPDSRDGNIINTDICTDRTQGPIGRRAACHGDMGRAAEA